MSFFQSIEFFVISTMVAAGAVALVALPRRSGPGRQHLLKGELIAQEGDADNDPRIDIQVDRRGRVHIVRRGLSGIIRDTGAVSLAVNVIGFDITIQERLTPGSGPANVEAAFFTLDFLGRERYHIRYDCDELNIFTAFTLNVEPGIAFTRQLKG